MMRTNNSSHSNIKLITQIPVKLQNDLKFCFYLLGILHENDNKCLSSSNCMNRITKTSSTKQADSENFANSLHNLSHAIVDTIGQLFLFLYSLYISIYVSNESNLFLKAYIEFHKI